MPLISAIVPARNEQENIEASMMSLAAQPEIAEIIVVDDDSTDRTPEILSRLATAIPQLQILRSGPLPSGWTGKNHALWLGAQNATCDWLLFADADTVLLPGAAHRAIEDARVHNAALVSYSPEQRTETLFERALIPFIYSRLAHRFDFSRVNDPSLPDAAANGQFILIRRDVYEKSGGHRAIAGAVLEDVALAQRVKANGYRLYFAPGAGIARTRMYRNFAELWQGWTKNLYSLLGGNFRGLVRELALACPWLAIILILAGILERGNTGVAVLLAGLALLILRHLSYARELAANRYPRRFIIYYSIAASVYFALVIASASKHWRGKVVWRGREYPVRPPTAKA